MFFFYFGLILSCGSIVSSGSSEMKLELIQVLFRHGDRTPAKDEAAYVCKPTPDMYDPVGFENLTNKGKQQGYTLGTLLRKKYDAFLGSYKPSDVYAITSDFDRTKMTLQLVLAGLYSSPAEKQWHPKLKWQPMPYGQPTDEFDDINVLLVPHQLPKYKEVYEKELAESKAFHSKIAEYADFLKTYEKNLGIPNIVSNNFVYHIGKPAMAMIYHKDKNMSLPDWCTDETVATLLNMYPMLLDTMSASTRLKRLNGGTLVRKAVETINENRNAKNPKKICLYSAHDLTVAAFVRAQNVNFLGIPPTGGAIVLEKYSDDKGKEYVRIVRWDAASDDFDTLRFGSCEEYCPYEEYLKLVKDVIPSDQDLEFLVGENDNAVQ